MGYAQDTKIVNCHNTAAQTGVNNVGGIIGGNVSGTIIACSNSGLITGKSVGGIAGYANRSNIIGCFNTANAMGIDSFAGAIAGICNKVTACWSAASAITSTDSRKGGIVGWVFSDKAEYCYWKTTAGISSAAGSGNSENCAAFSGDAPSAVQIKAMNDAWQAADATREYQFNATTGMIEKKP